MRGQRPRGTHVLAGARHGKVGRVQIELVVVRDIPGYAGALEQVDMLAGVDDACHVVQVLRRRIAIAVASRICDRDRGTGRRKMYPAPADVKIVGRVLAVQHEIPLCQLECPGDNRPWKSEAPVVTQHCACGCTGLDTVRCRVIEPDLCKDPVDVGIDGGNTFIAERLVPATLLAAVYRLDRFCQWRASQRPACCTAAGSSPHDCLPRLRRTCRRISDFRSRSRRFQ